ncbi:FKBP-type peptidyl-prolyl cis-trans isomerase [Lacinutrix iliipiscaria]|uniref:peptidylprolyl isomerase n=1 Tax=Lacinutrix iliipiscaria TaxID=1230532 RepID=A0ABW5WSC7_9FLAO
MKLRKITLGIAALMVTVTSCNKDDESTSTVPDRDRAEVYAEDIVEIEEYLETHFYNYEEFDFGDPYSLANDTYKIVVSEIPEGNPDNVTSLMDSPELSFKMVTDPSDETIEYKLYYLTVREGLGSHLNFIDQAFVSYEGTLSDETVFDSAVTPVSFNLTTVGLTSGVVTGFRESLLEFKTSTGFTDNGDGTLTYHGHGIGMSFIPSGIGYFSQPIGDVDSYTPIFFKFNLVDTVILDHDNDGIPSYLEDLDGDKDVFSDDTDEDVSPNFLDTNDDGDSLLTVDEIEKVEYIVDTNIGEMEPILASNEYEVDRSEEDGVITINTIILTDSNSDGIPDYLDDTIE